MSSQRCIPFVLAAALLAAMPARAAVEILEQNVIVDLTGDPSAMSIAIEARVAVTPGSSTLKLMTFAMPTSVFAWNGTPLVPSNKGWYATVDLPPAAAISEGKLTVELSGVPPCAYGGGYEICHRGADHTYLLAQLASGVWYLFNVGGESVDTFQGSLTLRLPAGQRAAAMGAVPVVVDHGDGTATWTFTFDWPAAELTFVAGAYEELQAAAGGFPARGLYAAGAGRRELVQGIVDEASRMAAALGPLWGVPPMAELQYATISGRTPFAGTSAQGLILLSDVIFNPAAAYLVPQVNHELGHLWWGTMASGHAENENGFFAESLAEYTLWRALGLLDGAARRRAGTRMNAVWYMYRRTGQEVPVLGPLGSEEAIFAVYHKGSCVVRTLEEAVGATALDAGLRAMVQAGPYGATIKGFVAAVQAGGGGDITPFLATWLQGTGFPKLRVGATLAASGSGQRLALTAQGDAFPMRLPVVVHLADGTTVAATLDYAGGAATAQLDLASAPALVEVDPDWTAVRELAPVVAGDVSFDGTVDGADLIEVALRVGAYLPTTRRVDGAYDPLYDIDADRKIDAADLDALVQLAAR